jgi:two-component system, NtrC family, nitrogen regulation sensor histidine kinase GlnL
MTAPALHTIFDALPNPVVVLGHEDQVCFANSAAEDFFQLSTGILLRQHLDDLVPFASPVLQSIRQVRNGGGAVNEYAVAIGTPRAGGERIVDLQTSSVTEDPRFVVLMILRRSMAQKMDSQLSHQVAARSVTGMAAMLAHEIKNPLAGIRGAAQLLEPELPESDRSLARLICSETDRIRDLVDQMEVFSDERQPDRKPINIHFVLDRVKQLMTAAQLKGIQLREDYDPSLPAVYGNHDQLVQVLLNLTKNAAEAIALSGAGGEIVLTTAFRPGVKLASTGSPGKISLPLEVCVHDDGPGVPEELRPHIFDPFITSKETGRGLGLALVAKIVRDHGGVIECLPRAKGTTFRILLPLTQGADNAPLNPEG